MMKKRLTTKICATVLAIMMVLTTSLTAAPVSAAEVSTTYYIDAANGDDLNEGTSESTAWKTTANVNTTTFLPGDSILLAGGQIHDGSMSFSDADRGTSVLPITISSYGTGKANINSGNGLAIYLGDTAGFKITNLKLTGSGSTVNSSDGITLWNGSGKALDYLYIENVEITGYKQSGIFFGVSGGEHVLNNVTIKDCLIYDVAGNGICSWGGASNIMGNIKILGTIIHDIKGVPEHPNLLGNGIVLGMVKNSEIAGCVTYNCGDKAANGVGIVGAWCYNSDSVIIQKNESFDNKTSLDGGVDGGGFDLDQYTTNSYLQYNYSHNNHGAGYLLCANGPSDEIFSNNTVRYNVSVNDARRSGYGAVTLYGKVKDSHIYNNTIYIEPSSVDNEGENPKGIYIWNDFMEDYDVQNVSFRNNIIQTTGGMPLFYITQGQVEGGTNINLQGNCYYATGDQFTINWGSTTYSSIEALRTGGNEKVGNINTGINEDPLLTKAETMPSLGTTWGTTSLDAYKIAYNSPCVDAGLNLSDFGINVGTTDFWGNSIPKNNIFDIGANEIGANETLREFEMSVVPSINQLAGNQLFTAVATATNISSTNTDHQALFVVALYDANDSMVNVSYISRQVNAGGTETINAGFKLPSDVTGYKVKIMLIEGNDISSSNLTALAPAVVVTVNGIQ